MIRRWTSVFAILLAIAVAASPAAARRSLPASWDNLVRVNSRQLGAAYILPGTDFRRFTKVIIDTPDVAFRENWQRNFNNSTMLGLSHRITNADVEKAIETARTGLNDALNKAYTDAGFQVVTTPSDDVLRVKTAVVNLVVTAPDRMVAGRSRTYSETAGEGTFVIEAHDSMTGAILGRAVDRRAAGNTSMFFSRNRATNRNDFRRLFQTWAQASASGLTALKASSPVAMASNKNESP